MIELTLADIARITGGTPTHVDDLDAVVSGSVEFDSRKLTPGSLFIALPGARVDGHDFADAAVKEHGAVASLVARDVNTPAIVVPHVDNPDSNADIYDTDPTGHAASVLAALSALARHVITTLTARTGLLVVGVTGSAGKTSTKDLMATVFSAHGETVAPPGSFNNEIGHPYTALRCTDSTRVLVAEMSARGVGHIAHLATIAPPKIGVVLNVGTAHLGEFGGRDVIAQAKGELVESLPAAADGGVAVLNLDDEYVAAMAQRTDAKVVFFSTSAPTGERCADTYYATDIVLDDLARPSFTLHTPDGRTAPITLNVAGAHQVSNALAAAAAALEAGLVLEDVAAALSAHQAASANRMDLRQRADGVTIINDSYNANPDSMRAGITALSTIASRRDGARAIAVLGQMGELGDAATEEHEALADVLHEHNIDILITVGTGVHTSALAAKATQLGIATATADSVDAAINLVDTYLSDSDTPDVVLVKASMVEGLWRVADGLAPTQP